jgi:hypothetical protein
LPYLLKYLSLFDLKLIKLVLCAGGTRSAKAVQLIEVDAMRRAAIFLIENRKEDRENSSD